MKKLSDEFVLSVAALLTSFLIFQVAILPGLYRASQTAAVRDAVAGAVSYSITPSKVHPSAYRFTYQFASGLKPSKEQNFDLPIEEFSDKIAQRELPYAEFGQIRDAWNYPVRENAYMALGEKGSSDGKNTSRGDMETRSDDDPENLGIVNCRADTGVTGYFKAYFEDVALATGVGYNDPDFGQVRRDEACQVLQDISILIKLNLTTITPDILFQVSDGSMPTGALAGASTYFGYEFPGADNGALHRHILSGVDPRTGAGEFDAYIMTNWNGISWDVDSDLNPSTYDFYSVIYHEAMHALGFMGRLPAPVITTGDFHPYTSFNGFTFADDSLANPFISNGLLSVPTGVPSPWYVNNTDVYRGRKNVIAAAPDGIRPVFSPIGWQQGSSLSHFDMERAPGEVYVMNRNIGPNTERVIHTHEKEVLCHIGYQVVGITDCGNKTPIANPDSVLLSDVPVCINPLLNDDTYAATEMYSLTPTSIEAGDQISYWSNAGCSGTLLASATSAHSLLFTPVASPEPRFLTYVMKFVSSTRLSFPSTISLVVCTNPEGEYVCNGDFEMNPIGITYDQQYTQAFQCPSAYDPGFRVPYWCGVNTPDLATNTAEPSSNWVNLPFPCYLASALSNFPSYQDCLVDTPDGSHNAAFIYARNLNNSVYEEMVTELEAPLDSGDQYVVSFDYFAVNFHYGQNIQQQAQMQMTLTDNLDSVNLTQHTDFPEVIYEGVPIYNDNAWHHVSQVFTAEGGEGALISKVKYDDLTGETTALYLDNISIRRYNPNMGSVSGLVYEDTDVDGVHDVTEPKLSGIPVGIFHVGETVPFATTVTLESTDEGEYLFPNIPDGDYRVALIGENVYSLITEPTPNTLLPGYSHARIAQVTGGQAAVNHNFGTVINVPSTIPTDVRVRKSVLDNHVSMIDRNVSFQVVVRNQGASPATNISIYDPIPAGVQYYSYVALSPDSYDPATGLIHIPLLQPGELRAINIVLHVPLSFCGTITNVASLSDMDQEDTDPSNNIGTTSFRPKCLLAPQLK